MDVIRNVTYEEKLITKWTKTKIQERYWTDQNKDHLNL